MNGCLDPPSTSITGVHPHTQPHLLVCGESNTGQAILLDRIMMRIAGGISTKT